MIACDFLNHGSICALKKNLFTSKMLAPSGTCHGATTSPIIQPVNIIPFYFFMSQTVRMVSTSSHPGFTPSVWPIEKSKVVINEMDSEKSVFMYSVVHYIREKKMS